MRQSRCYSTASRFEAERSENGKYRWRRNLGMATECKYWLEGTVCVHETDCKWIHWTKSEDLRKRVTNYMISTKSCVDPGRGLKCEYEDRCNFAYPGEALGRTMPLESVDKQYFKLLLRDCT